MEWRNRVRPIDWILVAAVAVLVLSPLLALPDSLTLNLKELDDRAHYSVGDVDLRVTRIGAAFKCDASLPTGVRCLGSPLRATFRITYWDGQTQDVDFTFGGSWCTPGEPTELVVRHLWTVVGFRHVCGEDTLRVTAR